MSEDKSDIIPTPKGVEALRKLEQLDWTRAIAVPSSSEDRNPVRVFPNSAFIERDLNVKLFDPQKPLDHRSSPPIYFATYPIGIMPKEGGSKPDEIRVLIFPVISGNDSIGVEDEIFQELSQQTGKDVRELKRNSSINNPGVQVSVGLAAPNIYNSFRMILKTQPCVETGIDGEVKRDYPHTDPTLYSGWTSDPDSSDAFMNNSLVMITEPHSGVFWYVDIGYDMDILDEKAGKMMSPPLTYDSMNHASQEEVQLINKLVEVNS